MFIQVVGKTLSEKVSMRDKFDCIIRAINISKGRNLVDGVLLANEVVDLA